MIKWVTRREWVDTHTGEITYKEPDNYKIIKKQIKRKKTPRAIT